MRQAAPNIYYGYASILLYCLLLTPQALELLEDQMVLHMLVQIPLLIAVGWFFGLCVSPLLIGINEQWNRYGISGLILGIFTLGFWMLPQNLDGALSHIEFEIVKLVSLPFLCGLPLGLSWSKTTMLVRGFLKANFISMLLFVSWAYTVVPFRVCNNYLVTDQEALATTLFYITGILSLLWGGQLFTPPRQSCHSHQLLSFSSIKFKGYIQ